MKIQMLLTYSEAGKRLGSSPEDGISKRSVMRLCQQGKLQRVYPLKGKPRIVAQSVDDYIASLIAGQYDKPAHSNSGYQPGENQWPDCTPVKSRRTGTTGSQVQMKKKLEDLLKSH